MSVVYARERVLAKMCNNLAENDLQTACKFVAYYSDQVLKKY